MITPKLMDELELQEFCVWWLCNNHGLLPGVQREGKLKLRRHLFCDSSGLLSLLVCREWVFTRRWMCSGEELVATVWTVKALTRLEQKYWTLLGVSTRAAHICLMVQSSSLTVFIQEPLCGQRKAGSGSLLVVFSVGIGKQFSVQFRKLRKFVSVCVCACVCMCVWGSNFFESCSEAGNAYMLAVCSVSADEEVTGCLWAVFFIILVQIICSVAGRWNIIRVM